MVLLASASLLTVLEVMALSLSEDTSVESLEERQGMVTKTIAQEFRFYSKKRFQSVHDRKRWHCFKKLQKSTHVGSSVPSMWGGKNTHILGSKPYY